MSKSKDRAEILVRIIADLVILNLSLWAALLSQLLRPRYTLPLLGLWWPSACLISAIAPLLFYRMGFYTKGRSYAGKYKALVIIQAAALLFVVVALCLYFLRLQPSFPRSSFLLDWAISSALLLSARLWSKFWKHAVI